MIKKLSEFGVIQEDLCNDDTWKSLDKILIAGPKTQGNGG
jgi:hypothetical protein